MDDLVLADVPGVGGVEVLSGVGELSVGRVASIVGSSESSLINKDLAPEDPEAFVELGESGFEVGDSARELF